MNTKLLSNKINQTVYKLLALKQELKDPVVVHDFLPGDIVYCPDYKGYGTFNQKLTVKSYQEKGNQPNLVLTNETNGTCYYEEHSSGLFYPSTQYGKYPNSVLTKFYHTSLEARMSIILSEIDKFLFEFDKVDNILDELKPKKVVRKIETTL